MQQYLGMVFEILEGKTRKSETQLRSHSRRDSVEIYMMSGIPCNVWSNMVPAEQKNNHVE